MLQQELPTHVALGTCSLFPWHASPLNSTTSLVGHSAKDVRYSPIELRSRPTWHPNYTTEAQVGFVGGGASLLKSRADEEDTRPFSAANRATEDTLRPTLDQEPLQAETTISIL